MKKVPAHSRAEIVRRKKREKISGISANRNSHAILRIMTDSHSDPVELKTPVNPEAERSALRSMLSFPHESICQLIVTGGTTLFGVPAHRILCEEILQVFDETGAMDRTLLNGRLASSRKLKELGGLDAIDSILESAEKTPDSLAFVLKILREFRLRRDLIQTGSDLIRRAMDEAESADMLADSAEVSILSARDRCQNFDRASIKDHVMDSIHQIEDAYAHKERGFSGLASGFRDLDSLTQGFHPGELILIAGLWGVGKSTLAANLVTNLAVRRESRSQVGWCSLQDGATKTTTRMMASLAEVSFRSLVNGMVSERRDFPKLMKAAQQLAESPIYMDDCPSMRIMELRALARHWKRQYDIKLLVVDSLGQIENKPGGNSANEQEKLTQIAQGLRAIAKELLIPVVLFADAGDRLDWDTRSVPLSDLPNLWPVAVQADSVILLKDGSQDPGTSVVTSELHVLRQRHGPRGLVRLVHFQEQMRFADWSDREDDGS